MAGAAPMSSAVTGWSWLVQPTTMRPSRACRSARSLARHRAAITSLEAVIWKPDSRGIPSSGPPRPSTTWRRNRSFMSTARGQVTRRGSSGCLLAELQAVVDQRREQVVRRGDGVQVAGEVQVDRLGRLDRGRAAPGATALHPEHRAQRRLPQRQDGVPAAGAHPHGQGDGHRGLALARGRGGDRRDEDQPTGRLPALECGEVDLRPVRPPADHMLRGDPQLGGDIGHRAQFGHSRSCWHPRVPGVAASGMSVPGGTIVPCPSPPSPARCAAQSMVRGKPREDVRVEQRER